MYEYYTRKATTMRANQIPKRTKKNYKEVFIAIIALAVIVTNVLSMVAMGVYSVIISVESRLYTETIIMFWDDAAREDPSQEHKYREEIYATEDKERKEIYNRNAYTEWFFYELTSRWERLGVIVMWFIVPAAQIVLGIFLFRVYFKMVRFMKKYIIKLNKMAPSSNNRR